MPISIVLEIRPTKTNKKILLERGLFSDDPRWFFDLYETLLEGKDYRMVLKENDRRVSFIEAAGLKF